MNQTWELKPGVKCLYSLSYLSVLIVYILELSLVIILYFATQNNNARSIL